MSVVLGKISGIPIRIDYTLIIIFLLIIWTVGFGLMPSTYPGLGELEYVLIGILSAILLFVSILVHELAHSIVAKRNGLKIKQITLFLFGGVSEMEEEPPNAGLELKMSAAGPLTSILILLVSLGAWQASLSLSAPVLVQAPLQYTTLVNVFIAGFNLIPAFPLDGGRIFRSLLWRRNRNLLRSTRTASNFGRGFAYFLILMGIFLIFASGFVSGLWLILIGWFISSGAQSSLSQTEMQYALSGLTAADLMSRNVDSVDSEMTLEELYQAFFRMKHNGFPVLSGVELEGVVTAHDLRKVKKEQWTTTLVRDIMTPREKLITIRPMEPAGQVFVLMSKNRVGRLFVVDEQKKLVGIITRSDILRTVQIKEQMGTLQAAASERATLST